MSPSIHRVFGTLATFAVLATVVWGISRAGTPQRRRTERFDERRLQELRDIHSEILALVRDPQDPRVLKRPLPRTLEDLAGVARYRKVARTDPETGEPYEYRVEDATTYVLCARFVRPRDATHDVFWNHPAGLHCFRVDARDPP